MPRCIPAFVLSACLGAVAAVHASDTLRVDSQVLTRGDSAERVVELLGKPARTARAKAARPPGGGSRRGGVKVITGLEAAERWQYRRGDHVTTITLVDGRVVAIDDRRR